MSLGQIRTGAKINATALTSYNVPLRVTGSKCNLAHTLVLQADHNNSGTIAVGSGATATECYITTTVGVSRGLVLDKGDMVMLNNVGMDTIFLSVASAGDALLWIVKE